MARLLGTVSAERYIDLSPLTTLGPPLRRAAVVLMHRIAAHPFPRWESGAGRDVEFVEVYAQRRCHAISGSDCRLRYVDGWFWAATAILGGNRQGIQDFGGEVCPHDFAPVGSRESTAALNQGLIGTSLS